MMNKKILIYIGITILIVGLLIGSYFVFRSPWEFREDRPIKIFILNSYKDAPWANEQNRGFKDYLNERGIDFEVKKFNMNLFEQSSEEQRQNVAKEAIELIEEYGPDLVYSLGAEAQKHVGMNYVDSELPWVFSGVIHSDYDVNIENVAGILEVLEVTKYFNFFTSLIPTARKYVFIYGDSEVSRKVIEIIKKQLPSLGDETVVVDSEIVRTFGEFKEAVLRYQDDADLLMFDFLETLSDEDQNLVSREEVAKWLIENSRVPEFANDKSLVEEGLFCSLEISRYGLGKTAGRFAYKILIEGEAPFDLGIIPAEFVDRTINLARAEQLNLIIPSSVLINAEVIEEFPWDAGE